MFVPGIVAFVFVVGVVLLYRWLRKWRDVEWDGEQGRARAFLWSKKGTSGR
ncbi:MAG: hypothetical protein M3323_03565 [Actinomycetota bacterium]|nr:hypothetical protein [Actinomycetota bacterium]